MSWHLTGPSLRFTFTSFCIGVWFTNACAQHGECLRCGVVPQSSETPVQSIGNDDSRRISKQMSSQSRWCNAPCICLVSAMIRPPTAGLCHGTVLRFKNSTFKLRVVVRVCLMLKIAHGNEDIRWDCLVQFAKRFQCVCIYQDVSIDNMLLQHYPVRCGSSTFRDLSTILSSPG